MMEWVRSTGSALPREASHAIAGASTRQALTEGLVQSFAGRPVDLFSMALLCNDDRDLDLVVTWDRRGDPIAPPGSLAPREAYPGVSYVTADTPFLCDDCATDERLSDQARKRLAEVGVVSMAHYPLIRNQSKFVGMLTIAYRSPHAHTPEDVEWFGFVAVLASVALESIERQETLARQAHRAKAIQRATQLLGSLSDEDEILSTAARLLIDPIGFVDCWIGVIDEDAGGIRERAAAGAGAYPGRQPLLFPLDRRDINIVNAVHTGQNYVVHDALRQAEREGWGEIARAARLCSAVVAPLCAGDEFVGAMGAGQALTDITEDEVTMFATFGSQIAAAIARVRAEAERKRKVEELEQANERQERLLATVRELSTPVMPVHDGILVLPLVGTIDSTRGAQVMDALLEAIQKDAASVVIIDVTGVPMVDTSVASHLVNSARAAELLGASCILVGISPLVAQTLVDLGVELGGIMTRSDLQAGISYALSLMGLRIRPIVRQR